MPKPSPATTKEEAAFNQFKNRDHTTFKSITYEIFREADMKEAVNVIAAAFTGKPGCPMAKVEGTTQAEFAEFAHCVAREAIKFKLSIVARDSKKKIVGVLFSLPLSHEIDVSDIKTAKHDRTSALMMKLDKVIPDSVHRDPNDMLHQFLIGVDPNYQGHGIAKMLVQLDNILLVKQGFKRALVECTNPISQTVFKDLGYTSVNQVEYKKYSENGSNFFSNIQVIYEQSLTSVGKQKLEEYLMRNGDMFCEMLMNKVKLT